MLDAGVSGDQPLELLGLPTISTSLTDLTLSLQVFPGDP